MSYLSVAGGNVYDINSMSGLFDFGWKDAWEATKTVTKPAEFAKTQLAIMSGGTSLLVPGLRPTNPFTVNQKKEHDQWEREQYQQRVGQAQFYLQRLNLYPGPISGAMDGNTQQALDQFRGAVGLPMGGPVTDTDIGALTQAAASQAAQTGIPLPGSGYQPQLQPSQLPVWVMPLGLLGGGLLLWRFLK